MDDTSDFMKQFGGSASANVVTILLVGLIMVLKKCIEKSKHSECKSCCFSFEVDNKTERSSHHANHDTPEDSRDDEEGMQQLHGGHNRRVRTESV